MIKKELDSESFNFLLEDAQPIIEYTLSVISNANLPKIDKESIVNLSSYLSIIYHMLIVSTVESLTHEGDVNKSFDRTLKVITKLADYNPDYETEESIREANNFIDNIFSRSKGNA